MTTIVDGRALAQEIKEELKKEVAALGKKPTLAVILTQDHPATLSFVRQKESFGKDTGIEVKIIRSPEEALKSRKKFRSWIAGWVHHIGYHGLIIQLPLPEKLDENRQYFLDSIIPEKDIDVLSSHALGKFATRQLSIQPPVVGAVDLICKRHDIDFRQKKIVIVGAGTLVGRPVAIWLLSRHLPHEILVSDTPHFSKSISEADVIISGAGQAGLITQGMVKDGVIAFDAGTSSEAGQIKGDLDPEIAKKALLFTPVPGGIGPLTVAMLFKNLMTLIKTNK